MQQILHRQEVCGMLEKHTPACWMLTVRLHMHAEPFWKSGRFLKRLHWSGALTFWLQLQILSPSENSSQRAENLGPDPNGSCAGDFSGSRIGVQSSTSNGKSWKVHHAVWTVGHMVPFSPCPSAERDYRIGRELGGRERTVHGGTQLQGMEMLCNSKLLWV